MDNTKNYADKEWTAKDITEEMEGTFAIEIISYFEEFQGEGEVCVLYLNDINIESQVENVALIKNAPSMYRLLEKSKKFLPKELLSEWEKIKENLDEPTTED